MKDQRSCTARWHPICSLIPTLVLLVASPAMAATNFITWTSPSGGGGGGISATVSSTVTAGALSTVMLPASDVTFISDFAAPYSSLLYQSTLSQPASITSTLSFSPALPIGAKLIAVDVDYRQETFTLFSGGAPLLLLEQRETTAAANSTFPTYNAGALITTATTPNANEASIFDVSGLSVIEIGFTGGNNSGCGIAVALPIAPVPALEPSVGPAVPRLALLPVRPNPSRGHATIGYTVPAAAIVSLRIFDAAGRHVRTLEDSVMRGQGTFAATWDGRSRLGDAAAAGVYFCLLESGDTRVAGRVVLIR